MQLHTIAPLLLLRHSSLRIIRLQLTTLTGPGRCMSTLGPNVVRIVISVLLLGRTRTGRL